MNCLDELVIIDLTVALVLFQCWNCSQITVSICKINSKMYLYPRTFWKET